MQEGPKEVILCHNMKSMLDIDKGELYRCLMQGNEDDIYRFDGSLSFQC
jgi:hypothetical protein